MERRAVAGTMKNSVCRITHLVNSGVRQLEKECCVVCPSIPSFGRRPRNGGVASTEPALAALVDGECASAAVTLLVEVLGTPPVLGCAVDQMKLRVLAQFWDYPHQEVSLGVVHEDGLDAYLGRLVHQLHERFDLRMRFVNYLIDLRGELRLLHILRELLVEYLVLEGVDSGGEVGGGRLEGQRGVESDYLPLQIVDLSLLRILHSLYLLRLGSQLLVQGVDLLSESFFECCHLGGACNFFGGGTCDVSLQPLQDSLVILLELGMFRIEGIDGSK